MAKLPDGYRISPEHVPVPGTHITEGIGLADIFPHGSERPNRREKTEAEKDEDVVLALTAAGLAIAAITGVYIRRKLKGKD